MTLYWSVAASAFQWRNPTANEMTLIREFPAVLTFQRLDASQPKESR